MSPISSSPARQPAATTPSSVSNRARCRTSRSRLPPFGSNMVALLCILCAIPYTLHAQMLSDEAGQNEQVSTKIPVFLSKGGEIIARENSTVLLDCSVKDFDDQILVMWKFNKGTRQMLLYAGNIAIEQKKAMYKDLIERSKDNNGLVIKKLTSDLVGEYRCELSTNPPKSLSYTVSMMTAPVIVPSPPSGKATVRKGDRLSLSCNVKPSPSPVTIQWKHNDKIIEDNSSLLQLETVQSTNEGTYTCIASNEIGERRSTFTVSVEYEPEITISEKIIHGPIGDTVEVKCYVKANPSAAISWQFSNNSRVRNSKKYKIENFERFVLPQYSILRITEVDLKDYDNYFCLANNSIGSATMFFEVTGRPSKPKFTSPQVGNDGDSYLLEWTLFSQSDIKSYELRYRELKHYSGTRSEWKHATIVPNKGDGSVHKQSFRIENLSQENGYELDLEAGNDFGKTRSDIFGFTTTGEGHSEHKVRMDSMRRDTSSVYSPTGFGLLTICLLSLSTLVQLWN